MKVDFGAVFGNPNQEQQQGGHPGLLPSGGGSPYGWSRLAKWRRCKRLHAFSSLGWSMLGHRKDAANTGSLIHQGIAHFHARRTLKHLPEVTVGTRVYTQEDRSTILPPMQAIEEEGHRMGLRVELIATAKHSTNSYIQQNAHKIEGYATEIEVPFELDVGAKTPATGLWDLIMSLGRDRKDPVDVKTAHSITKGKISEYNIRGQLILYYLAFRKRWSGDSRFRVLLIERMSKGPVQAQDYEVPMPDHLTRNALRDIATDLDRIVEDEQQYGTDPWNWPARISGGDGEGCVNKFGACPFLQVCLKGPRSVSAGLAAPDT